jgi:hypothetical protein
MSVEAYPAGRRGSRLIPGVNDSGRTGGRPVDTSLSLVDSSGRLSNSSGQPCGSERPRRRGEGHCWLPEHFAGIGRALVEYHQVDLALLEHAGGLDEVSPGAPRAGRAW